MTLHLKLMTLPYAQHMPCRWKLEKRVATSLGIVTEGFWPNPEDETGREAGLRTKLAEVAGQIACWWEALLMEVSKSCGRNVAIVAGLNTRNN